MRNRRSRVIASPRSASSQGPSRSTGWDAVTDRPRSAAPISSIAAATAWPWLTSAAPDAGGPVIGLLPDGSPFSFDAHSWYRSGITNAMNISMLGSTGSGKSTTACAIALRALAHQGRKVMVVDGKSDWARYADAYGGVAVRFGEPDIALNPLDVPAGLDAASAGEQRMRAVRVLLEIVGERRLTDVELLALSRATAELPADARLTDVRMHIADPVGYSLKAAADLRDAGRTLLPPLDRLTAPRSSFANLLDRPSTVCFNPDTAFFVASLGQLSGPTELRECAFAAVQGWMHTMALGEPADRLLVLDEAWQLLKHESAAVAHAERLRLARAQNLATMMIMHRPGDIAMFGQPGSTHRASVETVFHLSDVHILGHLTADDAAQAQQLLRLNITETQTIRDVCTGEFLWSVETAVSGRRSWLVQTARSEREARLWNTKAG